jgi:Heterokaryon incompatibility protein (HET)
MPKRRRTNIRVSNYRYLPLQSSFRQIRLIRLQPSPVLRDVVKCEIETFEMDEAPSYEAISYAWGDASDLTSIHVSTGYRMLITRSLDSALRYLRHRNEERLLWADAICIDQKNIAEKNDVVRQMHVIFHEALQVIVWLGQPIRPWSFRVILEMPEDNDENGQLYFRGKCQLENRLNSNARALLQFGRLPWFSRGWVVQEVCFAQHIQIQYGRHLLSWEHFEKVAVKLASVLPDFLKFETLRQRRTYTDIQEAISSLAEARLRLQKGQATTLCSLLPLARSKSTTDPRDKIFAFANLLLELPSTLKVDYGEDVKSLFMKVAQLLLSEVGLGLLAECESRSNSDFDDGSPSVPSWVPNWAESRLCASLPGGLSPTRRGHEFVAGSHLAPTVNFRISGDVLLLEAIFWDDIIFLDPLASATGITPCIQASILPQLGIDPDKPSHRSQRVRLSNISCATSQDLSRLCSRVEMCNRDPKGFKILNIDHFPDTSWAPEKHQNIVGRSLMLTSEHYVGWAPPATTCGDLVSILPGCHVPVVLRKVPDGNASLGNCGVQSNAEDGLSEIGEGELTFWKVIGEACKQLSLLFGLL